MRTAKLVFLVPALTFVLAWLGPFGCASSAPSGFARPDVAPGGPQSDAGGEGGGGFPTSEAGGSVASCGNSLDVEGCSCTLGTPARNCYAGPAQQAGVGACHMGQQTCQGNAPGEFASGAWGQCVGTGVPGTCASAGASCGTTSDGCGGVLDCGSCSGGQTCGATSPNACGSGVCTPKTCHELGLQCGPASDGCSGVQDCGSCSAPATCGGGGQPGVCACIPTTCAALGARCGSAPDGCGGTLSCGTCGSPSTCGGAGVPYQCGQPAPSDAGPSPTCAPGVLATGQSFSGAIVVGGGAVYWVDGSNVVTCPVGGCGGSPTTLATESNFGLAVDGQTLYWMAYSGGTSTLMSTPLGGGAGTPLATMLGQDDSLVNGLTLRGSTLYFVGGYPGSVAACGTGGCSSGPTTLASGQAAPSQIAVDATNLYWTNSNPLSPTTGDGSVMQLPVSGGSPITLASGGEPTGIAVDGTNVYWTDPTRNTVFSCAIGGCAGAPTTIASGQGEPTGIAVDSTNIYWVNNTDGRVMKCAVGGCGGTPTVIASGQGGLWGIAIDDSCVYWISAGSSGANAGFVARAPK